MTCADCQTPLVPARAKELPEGHKRLKGRGMCGACLMRALRAQPGYVEPPRKPRPKTTTKAPSRSRGVNLTERITPNPPHIDAAARVLVIRRNPDDADLLLAMLGLNQEAS